MQESVPELMLKIREPSSDCCVVGVDDNKYNLDLIVSWRGAEDGSTGVLEATDRRGSATTNVRNGDLRATDPAVLGGTGCALVVMEMK